jgi:predicted ribosomally synthesized peptide with nif11-like leader
MGMNQQENPISQFRKFQDAVMADETLQSHFNEFIESPNFDDASLIEFARQNGFSVVQQELDGVIERISDEALENVAGGVGGSESPTLVATRHMQDMNQTFNLQYLQLQQEMQSENRKFTTLSNVLKTKHDTAKATINNVR